MVTVDLNRLSQPGLAQQHTVTGAVVPAEVIRVVPTSRRQRLNELVAGYCVILNQKCCFGATLYQMVFAFALITLGACLGYLATVVGYGCVRDNV